MENSKIEKYWKKKEKILGVLGLSPYATFDFLKKIADLTPAKKDWEHIRVITDLNTKIPSRGRCLDLNEEDPSKYMNKSILDLEEKGADFIAIPCNTSHYFYDKFIIGTKVPVFNIIEETSKYIIKNYPKINKVGVMASKNTCKYNLYDKFLLNNEVEVIYPQNQDKVSNLIEEVKIGNESSILKKDAIEIIKSLELKGAEGIILGCTELPIVVNENETSSSIFDSNQILAMSCLNKIIDFKC